VSSLISAADAEPRGENHEEMDAVTEVNKFMTVSLAKTAENRARPTLL
jgi:hypothetical protein